MSYLDWKKQFEKKKPEKNSLGMSQEEFKKTVKEWKEKNRKKVVKNESDF